MHRSVCSMKCTGAGAGAGVYAGSVSVCSVHCAVCSLHCATLSSGCRMYAKSTFLVIYVKSLYKQCLNMYQRFRISIEFFLKRQYVYMVNMVNMVNRRIIYSSAKFLSWHF